MKSVAPMHMVDALKEVQRRASQILSKQSTENLLQLLIIILPTGSENHDFFKRVCETTVVTAFQYCSAKHVVEGNNTAPEQAFTLNGMQAPIIFFASDIMHSSPGEDFTSSVIATLQRCFKNYAVSEATNAPVMDKVGGSNSVPDQTFTFSGVPYVQGVPVIFFFSAVTHSPPEEDSTSNNTATRCFKVYAINDETHTPTLASITTVFVHVYGYHISMPVNLNKTTVGELVRTALVKRNIKVEDAHFQSSGSILDENSLLSDVNIKKDSNVFVTPRRRGGVQSYHLLCFEQLDIILQNNTSRMFKRVWLPSDHVLPQQKQFVPLLSPFLQYIIHEVLVCVLRDGHQKNICWGGTFRVHHFLMSNGRYDPTLATMPYTPDKGGDDCDQLYTMISTFRDRVTGRHPVHLDDLLNLLHQHDPALMQNPDFITFLINHPCLQSSAEKQMVYTLVDRMIRALTHTKLMRLRSFLNQSKCTGWDATVKLVSAFARTYNHQTYGADVDQGFHLGCNYLNHPPRWGTIILA